MSNMLKDVIEFIKEVRKVDLPDKFTNLDYKTKEDRIQFLLEEIQEFNDSKGDKYEELDAMIDLIYFALGSVAHQGVTPEQFQEAWNRVHYANMQKKAGQKAGRATYGVDAAKPKEWQAPTFEDIFNVSDS